MSYIVSESNLKLILNSMCNIIISNELFKLDNYTMHVLEEIEDIIRIADRLSNKKKNIVEIICLFLLGAIAEEKKYKLLEEKKYLFSNVIKEKKIALINEGFNVISAYILSDMSDITLDDKFHQDMLEIGKKYGSIPGSKKAITYIDISRGNYVEVVNTIESIKNYKINSSEEYNYINKLLDIVSNELRIVYEKKCSESYDVILEKLEEF